MKAILAFNINGLAEYITLTGKIFNNDKDLYPILNRISENVKLLNQNNIKPFLYTDMEYTRYYNFFIQVLEDNKIKLAAYIDNSKIYGLLEFKPDESIDGSELLKSPDELIDDVLHNTKCTVIFDKYLYEISGGTT